MRPRDLSTILPKTLGHAASDFEELSGEELDRSGLPPRKKGFGVPALYRSAHAYKDGLRPGDVILSIDGRSFESTKSFNNYIQTKTELVVEIEFLRNGKVITIKTNLHDAQDLQEECRTIEELEEKADFGEPYRLLLARGYMQKTRWDYLGLENLQVARKTAEANHRPLLVGLFGSAMCCVHLAFWTDPYKSIVADPEVQKAISKNVSLLVMKPEAYRLYRQYGVDSKFPALLSTAPEGEIGVHLSLRPDTRVSEVLNFLQTGPNQVGVR